RALCARAHTVRLTGAAVQTDFTIDDHTARVLRAALDAAAHALSVRLRRYTRARMPAGFAAATPDHRHVIAVPAHRLSALTACFARFVGIEFVRGSFCVRGLAALAGDLALLATVHRGETAVAPATTAALRATRVVRDVAIQLALRRAVVAVVCVRH